MLSPHLQQHQPFHLNFLLVCYYAHNLPVKLRTNALCMQHTCLLSILPRHSKAIGPCCSQDVSVDSTSCVVEAPQLDQKAHSTLIMHGAGSGPGVWC